MSDRSDLLKSLVRATLGRAAGAVRDIGPVARVRKAFEGVNDQRSTIEANEIASAMAQVPTIREIAVIVRDGAIRIEALYADGSPLSVSLFPAGATFAPRGAKEIRFRVEPEERAGDGLVSDLVGRTAALIAERAFRIVPLRDRHEAAMVDRVGSILSADLRTVPSVRRFFGKGRMALFLDVIDIASIDAEDGKLRITMRLPGLFGPVG
jgi:hypothetical protein